MKKATLLLLLFVSTFIVAQQKEESLPQDTDKKYEVKINAFSLIAISAIDLSYEKLLNKDSSFGVSLFYNFSDMNNDIVFTKKFSLTPHYRWFFSETRFARGFFVEGFGMLNTFEDNYYDYNNSFNKVKTETGFALGISVGGKFVTKSGFTAEVLLGIGRNIIKGSSDNSYFDNDIVGRGGISIGYRF